MTAANATTPSPTPAAGWFPRTSWAVLLLTSLGIAVYFPLQYVGADLSTLAGRHVGLATTYAQRPLPVRIAFYTHIATAGTALLVGPFQFSQTIRRRHLQIHRVIGRVYVVTVVVGGTAAFVMSFFSSVAFSGFFGFDTLAVLWVLTTVTAYRAIRRRDVASHRAWTMRSFALTYAAPTLRMWLGILIAPQILLGVPAETALATAYAPVPFLCWLPNLVVAELMIRRRGLPALHLTDPAPSPAQQAFSGRT